MEENMNKDFIGQGLDELTQSVTPNEMADYNAGKESVEMINASKATLENHLKNMGLNPVMVQGTIQENGKMGNWEVQVEANSFNIPWQYDNGFAFGLTELRKTAGIKTFAFDINGKKFTVETPDIKTAALKVAQYVLSTQPDVCYNGRRFTYLSTAMLADAIVQEQEEIKNSGAQATDNSTPDLTIEIQKSASGFWGLEGADFNAKQIMASEEVGEPAVEDGELLNDTIRETIATRVRAVDSMMYVTDVKIQKKEGSKIEGYYSLSTPEGIGFSFMSPFSLEVEDNKVANVNIPLDNLKAYAGIKEYEIELDGKKFQVEAKDEKLAGEKVLSYLYGKSPDYVYEASTLNNKTIPVIAERMVADGKVKMVKEYKLPDNIKEKVAEVDTMQSPWYLVQEDGIPFLNQQ